VAEIADARTVPDYNHPLAGKPLVVQLKILRVENPCSIIIRKGTPKRMYPSPCFFI